MKNVWPQSTCVECGRLIPNGCQQYCTMIGAGFCTHHFPAAVEERYNEMYAALEAASTVCMVAQHTFQEEQARSEARQSYEQAKAALRHAKGEL